MTRQRCLADTGGKHRWAYRHDSTLGNVRECRKCGVLQQRHPGKGYVQIPGGFTQLPGGWAKL